MFDLSKLNMKSPGYGSPVEWHQDWAFLPHTNDDLMVYAIMVDEVGADSGPLQIIPGSHKLDALPPSSDLDDGKVLDLCVKAGTAVLFDRRMWHRGGLNSSNTTLITSKPSVERTPSEKASPPGKKE